MKKQHLRENMVVEMVDRYENAFAKRKEVMTETSLYFQSNPGLYEAGFINGMRAMLQVVFERTATDQQYGYMTADELDRIVRQVKDQLPGA